jgi:hypothetical protein
MSDLDLTQGYWCLHHAFSVLTEPGKMLPAHTTGTNTDVTLRFTALELILSPRAPLVEVELLDLIGAMAMNGTWYIGEIIFDDPQSAALDKTRGQYWAKVFPGTHDDRHGVLIIQQNYALPGTPITNEEDPVRLFTGQYVAKDNQFFGHGADNWAGELFTFTLTQGACRPSLK